MRCDSPLNRLFPQHLDGDSMLLVTRRELRFHTASVEVRHSPLGNERLDGWTPVVRSLALYGVRGTRIVNSLYSPTLLSTAMLPPCAFVTMS